MPSRNGQVPRRNLRRQHRVQDADGQLADRQQRKKGSQPQLQCRRALSVGVGEQARNPERSGTRDGSEISDCRMAEEESR
jgi:hypothetical protein